MAGGHAGRVGTCALATLALLSGLAPRAFAIEAFDGRFQAHGFVEMQIRGLSSNFDEEVDLAQWYNVLNVELEFDILPDGAGPFDLLSAYIRGEFRYDAAYLSDQTGGAIFPAARTWGNGSRKLPFRLRSATDQDYGGAIDTSDEASPPGSGVLLIPDSGPVARNPTGWVLLESVELPVVDYARDETGAIRPDPRNPRAGAGALVSIRVVDRFTGLGTFQQVLLVSDWADAFGPELDPDSGLPVSAPCSSVSCRALPANIRTLTSPLDNSKLVGCTLAIGNGQPCPVANQVVLPVGSARTRSGPEKDEFNRLLDLGQGAIVRDGGGAPVIDPATGFPLRSPSIRVTDPLTGELATVSQLYGNLLIENIGGAGASPQSRIEGAAPDASAQSILGPNYYDPFDGSPVADGGICPINNKLGDCPDNRPERVDVVKRRAFPGFDTLFNLPGADGLRGNNPDFGNDNPPIGRGRIGLTGFNALSEAQFDAYQSKVVELKALVSQRDDPAYYTFEPVKDFKWTFRRNYAAPPPNNNFIMGPWLPENFFKERAVLVDRANPLRGRDTPTYVYRAPGTGTTRDEGVRYHIFDAREGFVDPDTLSYPLDPLDDRLVTFDSIATQLGPFVPGLDSGLDVQLRRPTAAGSEAFQGFSRYSNSSNAFFNTSFGGDFSGILPCKSPDRGVDRVNLVSGPTTQDMLNTSGLLVREGCIPYTNLATKGGVGEAPMRVAPDISNLGLLTNVDFDEVSPGVFTASGVEVEAVGSTTARGLYIPSLGLIQALQTRDFDQHPFNLSEIDRSLNHGSSQQQTYELKEAYFDMEFFDSRLWIRAGLQNIVWGKTELFRTTDQFNPQDLALASLPALEESRIALLSARAVYSLYDIGPVNDVRLEVAANFDRFEPADLGACGEPYTIDIICSLTTGFALHGLTGVGIAGVNRPPRAWNDIEGVEFGGRIEFRWDRFSFAIADFYGYNDFPYPDAIMFYALNTDPLTGRPRKAFATGPCENAAGFVQAGSVTTAGNRLFAAEYGDPTALPTGATTLDNPNDDYARQLQSTTILGIGIDEACLKPGGAPTYPNENRFDTTKGGVGYVAADGSSRNPAAFASYSAFLQATASTAVSTGQWELAGSSVDYALVNHPANQQLFSFICLGTVTIAASISPGACAWNIFGSAANLNEDNIPNGLADLFTTIFAGEIDSEVNGSLIRTIIQQTKDGVALIGTIPQVPMNRDIRDGRVSSFDGWPYLRTNSTPAGKSAPTDNARFLTMDSVLTNEQRALLGCGPFYGTRCDSSKGGIGTLGFLGGQVFYKEGGSTGGIDVLNAEASIVVGAIPGLEGTDAFTPLEVPSLAANDFPGAEDGEVSTWATWTTDAQPGTIDYANDAYCTRFASKEDIARLEKAFGSDDAMVAQVKATKLIRLPGCRGVTEAVPNRTDLTIDVVFEPGYDPQVDGCVFAKTMTDRLDPDNPVTYNVRAGTRNEAGDFEPDALMQFILNNSCFSPTRSTSRFQTNPELLYNPVMAPASSQPGARTLFHPSAGCQYALPTRNGITGEPREIWRPEAVTGLCLFQRRGFETEFIHQGSTVDISAIDPDGMLDRGPMREVPYGTAQVFRTEMHAWSWNFMQFLVITSCNATSGGDDLADADCFDPHMTWAIDRCSLSQPHFCRNVKGFLAVAGLARNDVRANGNPAFGKRTFLWHSGGEIMLEYARRNVLGFSMDFAEDVTKTNWGMEFTWIGAIPFVDRNSLSFATESDVFNLTVSVDRPTFINFLNANRTFFMNSQWFFQYVPKHTSGFSRRNPFNVLFTFAIFTGYFQDRFLPQVVTVYDFGSKSGGFLPQISYRFTEAFSVTFGVSFFMGQGQNVPMPVRGIAPEANRAGPLRYTDGTENLLSLIRFRDEAFMRLRWTF